MKLARGLCGQSHYYFPRTIVLGRGATRRNGNGFSRQFPARYSIQHSSAIFPLDESINFRECDIFIPRARILSISDSAARLIKSKLVCPIADSPTTGAGEITPDSRRIVSVPDLISNSGAIIGSFTQQLEASELHSPLTNRTRAQH
jgi:glutamate dehydrogenase/leucine dehydrogenase